MWSEVALATAALATRPHLQPAHLRVYEKIEYIDAIFRELINIQYYCQYLESFLGFNISIYGQYLESYLEFQRVS